MREASQHLPNIYHHLLGKPKAAAEVARKPHRKQLGLDKNEIHAARCWEGGTTRIKQGCPLLLLGTALFGPLTTPRGCI